MAAFIRAEKEDYFHRVEVALQEANFASSIAVQREGSMASVPCIKEVHEAMRDQ